MSLLLLSVFLWVLGLLILSPAAAKHIWPRRCEARGQTRGRGFEGQGSGLEGGWFKSLEQLVSNPPQETTAGVSLKCPLALGFVGLLLRVMSLTDDWVCLSHDTLLSESITEVKFERWDNMKLLICVRELGHHSGRGEEGKTGETRRNKKGKRNVKSEETELLI